MRGLQVMNSWRDRIGDEVKRVVDIDYVANMFRAKIKHNLSEGNPINFSEKKAISEMTDFLLKKGLKNHDIVHFLHVCEVLPYSNCGCCKHRINN